MLTRWNSVLALGQLLLVTVTCRPTDLTIPSENVDLVVSHGKHASQRLFGTFSATGLNYETYGNIVQVSTFRACDARRKGLDRTVFGHVAVIFIDEIKPLLSGCVALDNQARFAEKSGALALVVGPASRIEKNLKPLMVGAAKIPVIVLDDEETNRLRTQLSEAARLGTVASARLEFVEQKTTQVLKLQVFRPTVLNIALIGLLIILVLFITVLVFVKIRWRPNAHRDLWLRTLARSAVNKMEIRKIQKVSVEKRRPFCSLRKVRSSYLPVFGSLASVANTTSSQERCAICLEDYCEGAELRVLFCGHEFHPKCVDPWLLANRRCPLCQYDVVYKQYPKTESNYKGRSAPPTSDPTPLEPLLSASSSQENSPRQLAHATRDVRARRVPPRARSLPRRRPLRPREQVETAIRLGGYSSDVSSYVEREVIRVVL